MKLQGRMRSVKQTFQIFKRARPSLSQVLKRLRKALQSKEVKYKEINEISFLDKRRSVLNSNITICFCLFSEKLA